MKTFDRRGCRACENYVIAHRLHTEYADVVLEQDRQNFPFKTIEVRVHYVERHLNRIEGEAVLRGSRQHFQMNVRTFVAGEADKADLAGLLCLNNGLQRAPFRKNAVRIVVANYFVALDEIHSGRLKAAPRLINLAPSGAF